MTDIAGSLGYYAWVSSGTNDIFAVELVGYGTYFSTSGVPTVYYDVSYPARYDECIAVGASTDFDYRSQYSQYDETLNDVLDIVAPSNGGNWGIATTDLIGSHGDDPGDYTSASGISAFTGTSSACPLVAGCAALLLSKKSDLTPAEIKDILTSTADKIGGVNYVNGYNKYYGYGRVNIQAALSAVPPTYVPYDYPTIQEAIDAASDGDIIVVSPGAYIENLEFKGKNITLRSTGPTTPSIVNTTLIDGLSQGSVVTFSGTETSECVLSGFTIAYGSVCGISGNGTHATIENNVIINNTGLGGGICDCDGIIQNNQVYNNMAVLGGGVASCDGTIQYNSIWGNTGSGLSNCNGFIKENIISLNKSNIGGGLANCDAIIQGNVISYNTAENDGGGLWVCDGTIQNNIIYGNEAKENAGAGGGLLGCGGIIQNNIIYDNKARIGGGLDTCNNTIQNNTIYGNTAVVSGGGLRSCTGSIRNCIIWGNSAASDAQIGSSSLPTYSCIQDWSSGGTGNISSDPNLASPGAPARDFHLRSGSPCIDAGENVADLSEDYEGDPRGFDGTSESRGDGSNFDIGADEYTTYVVKYNFQYTTQGWESAGQVQPFSAPNTSVSNGTLWLETTDNTNCFGYWNLASGGVPVSAGKLYLARFYIISADQDQSLVPTVRVRVLGSNFQQVDWLEVSSVGQGDSSPDSMGRWYDLFFEPASNATSVSPAFDVLNFNPSDTAQAKVGLSALHVYAYNASDVTIASAQKHYTFATGNEGWSFSDQVLPYTQLNTGVYSGALHLASQDNTNSFGYWFSPASDITLSATPTLYRATYWVSSDQSDASLVPELRLRVYTSNLQASVVKSCPSSGSGDNSPTQSARRYNLYFWSPTCGANANLQCAFDLLNFSPDDAANATLSLDDVNVEAIDLPWLP
jgi:hypothetical protein